MLRIFKNIENGACKFLLVFAVIFGSLLPSFVFAASCVKLAKVDHKIVEDRTSYFMIRFRGKI